MENLIVLVVLGAGIVILLIKAGVIDPTKIAAVFKPYRSKELLTGNEREFFGRLVRALPDHHVFPQVAMSAVVATTGGLTRSAMTSARNRFDRKVIDFVIVDRRTFGVVALIELDDWTHDPAKDAERDKIPAAAGYRTLRFQSRAKPELSEIRRQVDLLAQS